jgi:short-subunit dehydrogenase
MAPSPSFRDHTVLITGASSGIGRAAAMSFAREGARLVLAARRQQRLDALVAELASQGAQAVAVRCDVTRPEEVEAMISRTAEAFGGLDVLINNAGLGLYGSLEKSTEAQIRQVFEVNVFGLISVTRAALPLLREPSAARKSRRGATVINISSTLGHRGLPHLGAYSATKAAVTSLTESLRAELEPDRIRVIQISPGLTDTEFGEARLVVDGWAREVPPMKPMAASEVGEAILEACRSGRRDTVLTRGGKWMVYGNRLVPALMDRMARKMVGPPRSRS